MTECNDTSEALAKLQREDAQMRGEVLATGVLLAQLLQSMARKELNPHGFVSKIAKNASDAVEGIDPGKDAAQNALIKAAALACVKRYEEEIRSVLPV